jgi:hypothetical protein
MELHGEVGIEWVNLVRTVRCARALHATQQGQSIDTRYIAQAFSRRTRLPALPRRPIRANLVAAGEQVSTGGSMERAPLPPTLTTSTNPDEGTSHAERSFPATKQPGSACHFSTQTGRRASSRCGQPGSLSTPQPRPNPAREAARAAETVAGR